jgi:hypothetical protein
MKLEIPQFASKSELFDFLIKNKSTLIAQKMNSFKCADAFSGYFCEPSEIETIDFANKNDISQEELLSKDSFNVVAVINTTNVMDSHKDVHLPSIWNKSIKENKRVMHLQEHKSHSFEAIIADGKDLSVSVKNIAWKDLGYDAEGETQALLFKSTIRKERNPYMYEQYAKGYVQNHSVGMRYVKMALAVNDEKYEEEFKNWEKYIGDVMNKQEAEESGYFWAVTEAKVIEGSAVPLGSNQITPTISIKFEPSDDTQQQEAEKSLLNDKKKYFINLLK